MIGDALTIDAISDALGGIRVLAIDHRDSMRRFLAPDGPERVNPAEITALKIEIVEALIGQVTGVMLEPEFSIPQVLDAGVVPTAELPISRWRNVLMSALGGREANPVLTSRTLLWEDVMLLCTDGLTKHVSDDEIAEQLAGDRTAEEICRNLLTLTLERGATDNVTVVAGRLRSRQPT